MAKPSPTKITGYRDLSEQDIGLMNIIKGKAHEMDLFINALENRPHTTPRALGQPEASRPPPQPNSVDPRELALARTNFEVAFMHLVRAIAQPRSF